MGCVLLFSGVVFWAGILVVAVTLPPVLPSSAQFCPAAASRVGGSSSALPQQRLAPFRGLPAGRTGTTPTGLGQTCLAADVSTGCPAVQFCPPVTPGPVAGPAFKTVNEPGRKKVTRSERE